MLHLLKTIGIEYHDQKIQSKEILFFIVLHSMTCDLAFSIKQLHLLERMMVSQHNALSLLQITRVSSS